MADTLAYIHCVEAPDVEWLNAYLTEASTPDYCQEVSLTASLERDGTAIGSCKSEWTPEEDLIILATFRFLGTQWNQIAMQLRGRTPDGARNRWHRLQRRHGLSDSVKGRLALDRLLFSSNISKNWSPPPEVLSCTERASMASEISKTMWSEEEDSIIRDGVRLLGYKWRQISARLPGRSDSSVRNRWGRLEQEAGHSLDGSDTTTDDDDYASSAEALSPLRRVDVLPARTTPAPPSLKRHRSNSMNELRDIRDAPAPAPPPIHSNFDLAAFIESSISSLSPAELALCNFEAPSDGRLQPCSTRASAALTSHLLTMDWAGAEEEEGEHMRRGTKTQTSRPMWSTEEDHFIVRFVQEHGHVWSKMAERMEGRSHRGVRNRWLRMQKGQATRTSRDPAQRAYRCRRCGEPKLGHLCAAGAPSPAVPAL